MLYWIAGMYSRYKRVAELIEQLTNCGIASLTSPS